MLEWVISSAVLTALVIALRFLLKGKISLRLQYALWGLVLLRLLIPVSFGESGLSVSNLTKRAAKTETVQAVSDFTETALPRMSYEAAYTEVATEYAAQGVDIGELPEVELKEVEKAISEKRESDWNVRDVLKAVWIAGMAVVALTLTVSNLRFARKLKKSRRKLEGVSCPLTVYVSAETDTPCLFGLFRPAVYVTPEVWTKVTHLRYAVRHEWNHFRQGDPFGHCSGECV